MKTLLNLLGVALLIITLSFTPSKTKTVVIDVSHGGHDHGQQEHSITEKDIALQVAQKLQELSQNSSVEIILTRDSDAFVSLKDRSAFINKQKPHYMLSLHTNGHTDNSVSGYELFYGGEDYYEASKKLASNLSESLDIDLPSRGIKQAGFYLLKNTTCPSAFLEMGFLSNSQDRDYLTSESGQMAIATAIFKSLEQL
ncbi:N-acetylmuramoyl-L-alanine amidase [Hanstruepera neustonica]|uniref:N-acetylmuramoyl-L-alanine amidase n=1 Tax=Hanstruepera neustonica TaxID=1445657 RepID=A0A2K1DWZ2_9FLAO|nr:N-acetylmuramoyl-L-alanine amidase [Hanstruepera neustonica]PNQ72550.1 N-acetylmuramoyl-L-alanine amidase [Hanstruepera neustonica]